MTLSATVGVHRMRGRDVATVGVHSLRGWDVAGAGGAERFLGVPRVTGARPNVVRRGSVAREASTLVTVRVVRAWVAPLAAGVADDAETARSRALAAPSTVLVRLTVVNVRAPSTAVIPGRGQVIAKVHLSKASSNVESVGNVRVSQLRVRR